jgi:phosphohistidine phosphatase SixA
MRTYHRQGPTRILVCHADVDDQWDGPDDLRALSPIGRLQAIGLADRLCGQPISRVLSGPALPCRQTVVPLARRLWRKIEYSTLLGAHTEPVRLARFLRDDTTRDAVLCTHRETLLGLFSHYALTGSRFVEGIAELGAGAAWVLSGGRETPARLRYLPVDSGARWRRDEFTPQFR